MIPGLFDDPAGKVVRASLTGLQARQRAIANNIANVDTPGYKALDVDFESQLKAGVAATASGRARRVFRLGLETTDPRHIPLQPIVDRPGEMRFDAAPTADGTLRNDGNTVDIDREMTRLAELQISYNALGQVQSNRFGVLRTAINEGRR